MDFFAKLFGTYIDDYGYRRYRSNGRLPHRVVASEMLARKLKRREVVHHIDRDKTNNRPSNLYVFRSQRERDRLHQQDARRYGWKISYGGSAKFGGMRNRTGMLKFRSPGTESHFLKYFVAMVFIVILLKTLNP